MSNVIDLFSREPVPAAAESEYVEDFIEEHLLEFLGMVQELTEATTEGEFKECLVRVRDTAGKWPI